MSIQIQILLIVSLSVVGCVIGAIAGTWFYNWRHPQQKDRNEK